MGSLRARLFVLGVLAYFTYQYFEYAMALAYGPMFLVYVGIGALSVTGIALLAGGLDLKAMEARVSDRFPRRAMTGFGIFMAVLLAGMWLPLIARTWDATSVPQLNGGTTLVVQAFDLGFLVPLGLFTAVTVKRGLAVGYVLSAIVVVKGMAMGAGIASMLIVEWLATGVPQLPPILVFAAISLVCAALAWRVFGSIGPLPGRRRGRGSGTDRLPFERWTSRRTDRCAWGWRLTSTSTPSSRRSCGHGPASSARSAAAASA